jgi:hypothetical protein
MDPRVFDLALYRRGLECPTCGLVFAEPGEHDTDYCGWNFHELLAVDSGLPAMEYSA